MFGNSDLNIMGNNINQNGIVFKPELEVITQFQINMDYIMPEWEFEKNEV